MYLSLFILFYPFLSRIMDGFCWMTDHFAVFVLIHHQFIKKVSSSNVYKKSSQVKDLHYFSFRFDNCSVLLSLSLSTKDFFY